MDEPHREGGPGLPDRRAQDSRRGSRAGVPGVGGAHTPFSSLAPQSPIPASPVCACSPDWEPSPPWTLVSISGSSFLPRLLSPHTCAALPAPTWSAPPPASYSCWCRCRHLVSGLRPPAAAPTARGRVWHRQGSVSTPSPQRSLAAERPDRTSGWRSRLQARSRPLDDANSPRAETRLTGFDSVK